MASTCLRARTSRCPTGPGADTAGRPCPTHPGSSRLRTPHLACAAARSGTRPALIESDRLHGARLDARPAIATGLFVDNGHAVLHADRGQRAGFYARFATGALFRIYFSSHDILRIKNRPVVKVILTHTTARWQSLLKPENYRAYLHDRVRQEVVWQDFASRHYRRPSLSGRLFFHPRRLLLSIGNLPDWKESPTLPQRCQRRKTNGGTRCGRFSVVIVLGSPITDAECGHDTARAFRSPYSTLASSQQEL
jgi:hypothetical protein